jgi:hypothetical protein
MPNTSRSNNARTVVDYERTAGDYVDTVDGKPSASREALQRLADVMAPSTRVLEIGSGPGWDADHLESLGIDVHRTDAAAAFCEFQAGRGKRCDRLDLLTDRIEERYGGALMLCVLQHFDAGGPLLLMYPEGEGEHREHGAAGDYRTWRWPTDAMDARLARAGFAVDWDTMIDGRGGLWRTVLTQKMAVP